MHEDEEIQIKGRTCRQNDPGSFEMILFLQDLKKFNIKTFNEFDLSQKSKYEFLFIKRAEFQEAKASELQKKLDEGKKWHEKTVDLAKILTNHSIFANLPQILAPKQDTKKIMGILKEFN